MSTGPAVALAAGLTLYLAGDVLFRQVLGLGTPRYRAAAAAGALVACPVAVAVGAAAAIAVLTVIAAMALVAERRAERVTVEA